MNGRRWAQMNFCGAAGNETAEPRSGSGCGRTPLGRPRPLPRDLGRACGSRRRARFGASAADRLIDVWCRHAARREGEGTAGPVSDGATQQPMERAGRKPHGAARRGPVADTPRKKLTLQPKARRKFAAKTEMGTVEGIRKKISGQRHGDTAPLDNRGPVHAIVRHFVRGEG